MCRISVHLSRLYTIFNGTIAIFVDIIMLIIGDRESNIIWIVGNEERVNDLILFCYPGGLLIRDAGPIYALCWINLSESVEGIEAQFGSDVLFSRRGRMGVEGIEAQFGSDVLFGESGRIGKWKIGL
jgi:hypothetical protein